MQDVNSAVIQGIRQKGNLAKLLSQQLRDFVDANVNPDDSENYYDPSIDDTGALVLALQHPDVSTDPTLCLLCLTVCHSYPTDPQKAMSRRYTP